MAANASFAMWALLLLTTLLVLAGFGGVAAFSVSYLQGCDKSNKITQLWLNSSRLSGPIPTEIGKCTALQSLSLRSNLNVNGSIPREIGQLSNLVTLDLGSTNLSGPIPKELGTLSSLQTLNLASSHVSGPVPWDALCGIQNLTSLWLNNTKVEGPISADIDKCGALQGLSLQGSSKVNGSIPTEIGQLTSLKILELGSTNLTGPIPVEIRGLTSLGMLKLGSSNLTAPVPWESLCQMSKISYLDLSSNPKLSGPPPPPCFWNLTGLQTLWLSNSPVFQGAALPVEICQLVKLQVAYLGSTNLTGLIPACLGSISGLQQLALFSNALVGDMPPELGLLGNLSLLRLRDNQLTGNNPVGLRGLSQLTTLDLKNNNLTGSLPGEVFANLRQLEELDLSNNSFTGPIPTEIGASGENLTTLNLDHNSLHGSIPPGLGNLANLTHLDLSYNRLSGALPVELRGLRPSKLGAIDLSFNNLTGDVAPIGHLTGLSDIALNNNNFSGPIPTGWFNSTELQVLNLAFNNFSGPVPLGIGNMAPPDFSAVLAVFFGGAPAFVLSILEEVAGSIFIGLNSNQLSGSFPDIGRPKFTAAINVSDNNLSGTFRAGPFKKKNVTASFLELRNNGPLDLIPGYNLSGLELVSLPNISETGAPLVAPQMRALNVAGRGIPPSTKLDLRRVPATCPYVSYAQRTRKGEDLPRQDLGVSTWRLSGRPVLGWGPRVGVSKQQSGQRLLQRFSLRRPPRSGPGGRCLHWRWLRARARGESVPQRGGSGSSGDNLWRLRSAYPGQRGRLVGRQGDRCPPEDGRQAGTGTGRFWCGGLPLGHSEPFLGLGRSRLGYSGGCGGLAGLVYLGYPNLDPRAICAEWTLCRARDSGSF
jgi:Leucine-rich repeat (LRR) protein